MFARLSASEAVSFQMVSLTLFENLTRTPSVLLTYFTQRRTHDDIEN